MIPRILLFVSLVIGGNSLGGEPGEWPVERLKSEVPSYRYLDQISPVRSLLYQGEVIDGKPTEVFAFYASPSTLEISSEGPFPGIVLIHGGGGSAFADWVDMWARRGYAAIAMDLGGRKPPAPEFDEAGKVGPHHRHKREVRTRLENGGVVDSHQEKFQNITTPTREDDWPFHAVANVMRAHTLLRSFPEVDPERTAVTGISWGGFTTCLAASIDNRFKAAVPVYGCGFLHQGESVQKPSIDRLGPDIEKWVAAYDPSSHLGKCTVPTFWVNGTHDKHYVLDSYAKSYQLVQGPRNIRIEPRMGHSHPAGWEPSEIERFIDSILLDEPALPVVTSVEETEDKWTVHLETAKEEERSLVEVIEGAEVHFTTDEGLRSQREWDSFPAKIEPNQITFSGLPREANTWLVTVRDKRGAMVSSEVFFRL